MEGDVCELESKLDKVSTTHGKHYMIVNALHYEPGIFCGDLVKGFVCVSDSETGIFVFMAACA